MLTYLNLRNVFTLKKSSTFANLLLERPVIDLLSLIYKQPVYKQLALAWQIAKQL